jgi:hypothetical protein
MVNRTKSKVIGIFFEKQFWRLLSLDFQSQFGRFHAQSFQFPFKELFEENIGELPLFLEITPARPSNILRTL